MKSVHINNLGPIKEADVLFGDLTLLVGPQASGKSIFLQFIKLLTDKEHIRKILEQYGFPWKKDLAGISELYYGKGMNRIWTEDTKVSMDELFYGRGYLLHRPKEKINNAEEQVFYIPAQRVLCLENGWPKFFSAFDGSVPYVLRHYSETLRLFMDNGTDNKDEIFPATKRLKEPLRNAFNSSIYQGGKIKLDTTQGRKQFILEIGSSQLPFMTWSAGQKEFMPLLLSFYHLSPVGKVSMKDSINVVIIEEPEMGLHPQAIKSILLQVMDLMSRGYQVIISTHSPVFLEFAWAFKFLKQSGADNYQNLMELFDFKSGSPSFKNIFKNLMEKSITSYYFERRGNSVIVRDITTLDAGSDDEGVAEWGGLSSFSTKASDIVSKVAAL